MKYVDPTGNVPDDIPDSELDKYKDISIEYGDVEGIQLEHGYYSFGDKFLEYYLVTINLEIAQNIKIFTDISSDNALGYSKLDKYYKKGDQIIINFNFFKGSTIVGDTYNREGYWAPSDLTDRQMWFVAGNLSNKENPLEFGRTEWTFYENEEKTFREEGFGIPNYQKYSFGSGGVGGLIIDGEIVEGNSLFKAFNTNGYEGSLRKSTRPAIGANQEQSELYMFMAAEPWKIQDIASFMQKRGAHNAVFGDGSTSVGLSWKGRTLVEIKKAGVPQIWGTSVNY